MAKRLWFFLLIAVLGLGLAQGVLAAGNIQDDVVALKAKVAQAAKLLSKDSTQALKEFNDPQGEWAAEPHIFAYKLDGTCLAMPSNPKAVGTNRLQGKDVKGRFFLQEMIRLIHQSAQGQGWVEYKIKRPDKPQDPPVQKVAWVSRVPGKPMLVGAALYATKSEVISRGAGH
ncbi:MAG: cache domain-containing protein [Desulfarculus sp.]|nr:cache domain-containing protein [Desulfarculus sp.]